MFAKKREVVAFGPSPICKSWYWESQDSKLTETQLKMLKKIQNCDKLSCRHITHVFLMNIFIAEGCKIECWSFEEIWTNTEGETALIRNLKENTREVSTSRLQLPQMYWNFIFIFYKIRLIWRSQFSFKTVLTNCYNLTSSFFKKYKISTLFFQLHSPSTLGFSKSRTEWCSNKLFYILTKNLATS